MRILAVLSVFALAGCLDPLGGVDRVSEVGLPEDQLQLEALPDEGETEDAPIVDEAAIAVAEGVEDPQPRFRIWPFGRGGDEEVAEAEVPAPEA